MLRKLICLLLTAAVTACATQAAKPSQAAKPQAAKSDEIPAKAAAPGNVSDTASSRFYPSTYKVPPSAPTLIRHATVLTGTGTRLDGTDVLLVEGKIQAVGPNLTAPANSRIVEGDGLWVTPGLIDVHSHLGVYPSPQVEANSDGNEATSPSTANVW